ncbi:MAG: nucleotide sugar dehydrogenase [Phycisphaerales bacterium]
MTSSSHVSLRSRIDSRSAVVAVIGLGYVGLPLLRAFFDAGFPVLGFDIDPGKIEQLQAGRNYLAHLGTDFVSHMSHGNDAQRFTVTSDVAQLAVADAMIICVPTPLGKHRDPDLSYVEKTADAIAKVLRPGQLISLESTTWPGTTREVILPRLAGTGLKPGEDFFLIFSPEREDPGRRDHTTGTIPKLLGGIDDRSRDLGVALYACAIQTVVPVASAEIAEAAKLLENIYRAVNIALVNELKRIFMAMGIDIWDVIEAASTKPFGYQPFYPGPGLGGHCIPIDPFYLTWKAREVGLPTQFIELAGQVNHEMPGWVIQQTSRAFNRNGKSIHGSRVLILGLAYKPDIDDVRESPSFELITQLRDLGAHVDYNDPHVPRTHFMRHYDDLNMQSVPLDAATLAGYDCVIVATHHAAYDWQMIADNAQLVIDTRNAMKLVTGRRDHIVKA